MKNLSLFALRAAAVLAMTATMVACSDNDPEEPPPLRGKTRVKILLQSRPLLLLLKIPPIVP